ncbi:MAG: hypothetical protein WCI19_06050 [Betaproteobacteria bacterium]
MASISSISGAQSAAQSGMQQLRLQQATRNAEQAEQVARALQAQAGEAQRQATEAEQNARAVSTEADQAQANAGQARLGLAVIKSVGQMQFQVSNVVAQVAETLKTAEPAAAAPTPVVNAQGQLTGTVINTTA